MKVEGLFWAICRLLRRISAVSEVPQKSRVYLTLTSFIFTAVRRNIGFLDRLLLSSSPVSLTC